MLPLIRRFSLVEAHLSADGEGLGRGGYQHRGIPRLGRVVRELEGGDGGRPMRLVPPVELTVHAAYLTAGSGRDRDLNPAGEGLWDDWMRHTYGTDEVRLGDRIELWDFWREVFLNRDLPACAASLNDPTRSPLRAPLAGLLSAGHALFVARLEGGS